MSELQDHTDSDNESETGREALSLGTTRKHLTLSSAFRSGDGDGDGLEPNDESDALLAIEKVDEREDDDDGDDGVLHDDGVDDGHEPPLQQLPERASTKPVPEPITLYGRAVAGRDTAIPLTSPGSGSAKTLNVLRAWGNRQMGERKE